MAMDSMKGQSVDLTRMLEVNTKMMEQSVNPHIGGNIDILFSIGFTQNRAFLIAPLETHVRLIYNRIVKEQHNCKTTDYWYEKSIKHNFLLIAHEYLFVFRKPNL